MYFSTQDIYAGHEKKLFALSLVITVFLFVLFPLISRFEPEQRTRQVREIAAIKLRPRTISPRQSTPVPIHEQRKQPPRPDDAPVFRTPHPSLIPLAPGPDGVLSAQAFATDFKVKSAPDNASDIFDFSQVDVVPEPIAKVLPVYPLKARILGIEGSVELVFVVRPDGSVEQIEVESATPEGMFERVAVAAVGKWKYAPASKDGVSVSSRVRLPLKFNLSRRTREEEQ